MTLRNLQLYAAGPNYGSANITLQRFTLQAVGTFKSTGYADLTLPAFQLFAADSNHGTAELTLPAFVLFSWGVPSSSAYADLTLPYFTLVASDANYGTADLTLPYFVLNAIADGLVGTDYVAVMNILNFAMSEYQQFNFNSYCAMGEVYLGADYTGIHQLYGDDDNGEEIEMELEKTGMDFHSGFEKRPTDIYLGLYSQGDFKFEVIADDMSQLYMENCPASGSLRTFKIEPGKGIHGRYLGFNIKNLRGADLAITQVAMLVEILSRRAR